jgi:hypothetical protein
MVGLKRENHSCGRPTRQGNEARLGGLAIVEFTSLDFERRAQPVYDSLRILKLYFHNVWDIFFLYPKLYP